MRRIIRFLWRANAVLIFVSGLAILGILAYNLYDHYFSRIQATNIAHPANLPTGWTSGNFERIRGTDFAVAPVYSNESYPVAFHSKESQAARNYLFMNLKDYTSHWLLPNHDRVILTNAQLCGYDNCYQANINWLEFISIPKDSNGDKVLSEKDHIALGFANADGTNYQDVLTGIDQIRSSITKDPNTLVVIYSKGSENLVAEIDIPSRKVSTSKPLAPLAKP